jgi:hypothetical protein
VNPDFAIEPIIRKTNRDFFIQAKSGLTPPPGSSASVDSEGPDEAAAHGADFANAKSGVNQKRVF